MDFGELKRRIATKVHDPHMTLISEALYAQFVGEGIQDLKSAGWLLPIEEDESTTMVAATFSYAVPATFAYIFKILEEDYATADLYDLEEPQHVWRLGLDASVPTIFFNSTMWDPVANKKLKIIGQKRPTEYTADTDTVEDGFTGFLRMRAEAYALLYLASVPVEEASAELLERRIAIANVRIATANAYMADSHRALSQHPQEFRVRPSSRHVPTR